MQQRFLALLLLLLLVEILELLRIQIALLALLPRLGPQALKMAVELALKALILL